MNLSLCRIIIQNNYSIVRVLFQIYCRKLRIYSDLVEMTIICATKEDYGVRSLLLSFSSFYFYDSICVALRLFRIPKFLYVGIKILTKEKHLTHEFLLQLIETDFL